MFKVEVKAMPKENILDPQGTAVKNSLHKMGYGEVKDVRIGKSIELYFENEKEYDEFKLNKMVERLLVNDVIEDCEIIVCNSVE